MANVTPHATPAGGFPLVCTVIKTNGNKVVTTFPTSAAVNPADAEVEAAIKAMRVFTAGGTYGAAGT